MLRLFTVVIFAVVVVFDFTGVDVTVGRMFSGSESVSAFSTGSGSFFIVGDISFDISFWFSANIFVKSDNSSFLSDEFISSIFSICNLGELLVPATRSSCGFSPNNGVNGICNCFTWLFTFFHLLLQLTVPCWFSVGGYEFRWCQFCGRYYLDFAISLRSWTCFSVICYRFTAFSP